MDEKRKTDIWTGGQNPPVTAVSLPAAPESRNVRNPVRTEIESWFERHSDDMIHDLGRLVAINSVRGPAEEGKPNGAGPHAALMLAREMLEAHGFTVNNFEDIIITADMGGEPVRLGILAHLDIVEAGAGWDTEPFTLTGRGGNLYGRGASDDKGPAVAAMYAMYCVRDICPELRCGVRLILGSGEETGMKDVAQYLSKRETPPHLFTPDANYPVVNVEKGRFLPVFGASWDEDSGLPRVVSISGGATANIVPNRAEAVVEGFTPEAIEGLRREFSAKTGASISARADGEKTVITAEGAAAHAANPDCGLNAQTALIEMLAAMPFANSAGFKYIRALNRLFPHWDYNGRALGIAMSDDISGALTVNFGTLSFTAAGFHASFDSRTPVCADDADLAGIVRGAFEREGISLRRADVSKSHRTPPDSPLVQSLLRIYKEYTGNVPECLSIGGQTYVHGIPGGVAFGCALPGIDNRVHGANEFIGAEQLIVSAKMFAQAIIDMARG